MGTAFFVLLFPSPRLVIIPGMSQMDKPNSRESSEARFGKRLVNVLNEGKKLGDRVEADAEFVVQNQTVAERSLSILSNPKDSAHFYLRTIKNARNFIAETTECDPTTQEKLLEAYRKTILVLMEGVSKQIGVADSASVDGFRSKFVALMNETSGLVKDVNGTRSAGSGGETRLITGISKPRGSAREANEGWDLSVQNAVIGTTRASLRSPGFRAAEPAVAQSLTTLETMLNITIRTLPDASLKVSDPTKFKALHARQRIILQALDVIVHTLTDAMSNPEVNPGDNYEERKRASSMKRKREFAEMALNYDKMPQLAQKAIKRLYGIDVGSPGDKPTDKKI